MSCITLNESMNFTYRLVIRGGPFTTSTSKYSTILATVLSRIARASAFMILPLALHLVGPQCGASYPRRGTTWSPSRRPSIALLDKNSQRVSIMRGRLLASDVMFRGRVRPIALDGNQLHRHQRWRSCGEEPRDGCRPQTRASSAWLFDSLPQCI